MAKRTFNIMEHIEKKRKYIARKYGHDMTGIEKEINDKKGKTRPSK